jgi:hypothetical protein
MKQKQEYTSPKLVRNGTVDELTQQGGGSFVDVPQGTPVIGPISTVIGSSITN